MNFTFVCYFAFDGILKFFYTIIVNGTIADSDRLRQRMAPFDALGFSVDPRRVVDIDGGCITIPHGILPVGI